MGARPAAALASMLAMGAALVGCFLDLDGLAGGARDGACCLGAGQSCAPCGIACAADDCGGGPCVLAEGERQPVGVAIAGQYVLWTSHLGDRIRRLDLLSGRIDDFMTSMPEPALLVANGGSAVWVAGNGIWRCPLDAADCAVDARVITLLDAGRAKLIRGLAVDAQTAFWTEDNEAPSGAPVLRCDLEASCSRDEAILFSNTSHPRGIAADPGTEGHVYWATAGAQPATGGISRLPKDAKRDDQFEPVAAPIDSPWALALARDLVIWTKVPETGPGGVLQCPRDGNLCRGTDVAPLVGSGQAGIDRVLDLVSDGERVYWTDSGGGTVMQCELPQCAGYPVVVADGQQEPRGIAVAGSCVYWVDQMGGGRVLRKAK